MTWKELQQAAARVGAAPSDVVEIRDSKDQIVSNEDMIISAQRRQGKPTVLALSIRPAPAKTEPKKPGVGMEGTAVKGQATVQNPPTISAKK